MKRAAVGRALCTTVLVALCAHPAFAQSTTLEGGVTSLAAVDYVWETRLVPSVPRLGGSFSMLALTTGGDTVHRVMLDRERKLYFGYDARVQPAIQVPPADTTYRITFGPLTVTDELRELLGADATAWKAMPAPRFPSTRTLRAGETLELTLLTNADSGQRVAEQVTVRQPASPRPGVAPEQEAERLRMAQEIMSTVRDKLSRDATAADVELRLANVELTLRVDSTIFSSDGERRTVISFSLVKAIGDVSAPIVWISLPGRGRFLLSLIPRVQFARAGTARRNSLSFTLDRESYNLKSPERMVPGDAIFNVYVLRQPDWKPDGANDTGAARVGTADPAEYALIRTSSVRFQGNQ